MVFGDRRRASILVVLFATAIAACGGDGGGNPDANDTCTPVNDGNECTSDVCENNVPVNNPVAPGTACATGTCDATGTCVAAATCDDNAQNGDETDVDCGGSCAPDNQCGDGQGCLGPDDCFSGVCTGDECQPAQCGDGVIQIDEVCDDGNMTDGDGCDDGPSGNCMVTGCGNGVVTGTEFCDDGNTDNGDGCDNNCTATACGNEIVTGTEVCDDGNSIEGDGCDTNCTPSACGNEITAGSETCDDGNMTAGDGCDAVCAIEPGYTCTGSPSVCATTCGDGVVGGGEECDDAPPAENGDGCSATCTVEPGYSCAGSPSVCAAVCGDGMTIPPETCDDGNATPVDGCGQTCQSEPNEIEPNEDGTPQIGGTSINGNDFDAVAVTNATNNGIYNVGLGATAYLAAIGIAGDEDVYAITNGSAVQQSVRFDTWNRAAGTGFGVPCPDADGVDTGLLIKNAAGAILASNDDRSSAADRCSGLDFFLAPSQTVFVQVTEYGDNLAIPAYGLQVRPTPIICGDGNLVPAFEECDDGNTNDTDACSNACLLTAPINEVDPNDTTVDADASAVQITGDTTIRGAITPATDVDVYRVVVATTTVVRFETFAGALGVCGATTSLRLRDSAGVAIASDTISGINSCSAIVMPLTPGTYYASVEESGLNATIAKYFLQVEYTTDTGSEAEPPNTSGGNDDATTPETNIIGATDAWVFGDHTLATDIDVYAITIQPGQGMRIEIVEGDRAVETCESNDLDSYLTLFDGAGVQLAVDDDDGRGYCSQIDGTGPAPKDPAARNNGAVPTTWYIHVAQSSFATGTQGQFIYRLQVTVR